MTTPKYPTDHEPLKSSQEQELDAIRDDVENALSSLSSNADLAAHACGRIRDLTGAAESDERGPWHALDDRASKDSATMLDELAAYVNVLHERAEAARDLSIELQGLICEHADQGGRK